MSDPVRLRVSPEGSISIPRDLLSDLGWQSGTYLDGTVEGSVLRLRCVLVDPFAEGAKGPDASLFDRLLERESRSRAEALRSFEDRLAGGDPSPGPRGDG